MSLNVKGTQIALSKMSASENEYAMQIASVSSGNSTQTHLSPEHVAELFFSASNRKINNNQSEREELTPL